MASAKKDALIRTGHMSYTTRRYRLWQTSQYHARRTSLNASARIYSTTANVVSATKAGLASTAPCLYAIQTASMALAYILTYVFVRKVGKEISAIEGAARSATKKN